MDGAARLAALGWLRFGPDAETAAWAAGALPAARSAMAAPENVQWWRCGGTWFAGVNVLPNDAEGRVGASGPLAGAAVRFVAQVFGTLPWDAGQVSVTRPGYPRPGAEESATAAGYRRRRDAAHVDGLLPVGPARRRQLLEPHAFILGLALTEADARAAPLVVWEESPALMRRALGAALAAHPVAHWPEVDLTDAYHRARQEAFATCPRVELPMRPGEAILLDRLALHGVAPWADGASAAPEGRMIAYFRPLLPGGAGDWIGRS